MTCTYSFSFIWEVNHPNFVKAHIVGIQSGVIQSIKIGFDLSVHQNNPKIVRQLRKSSTLSQSVNQTHTLTFHSLNTRVSEAVVVHNVISVLY